MKISIRTRQVPAVRPVLVRIAPMRWLLVHPFRGITPGSRLVHGLGYQFITLKGPTSALSHPGPKYPIRKQSNGRGGSPFLQNTNTLKPVSDTSPCLQSPFKMSRLIRSNREREKRPTHHHSIASRQELGIRPSHLSTSEMSGHFLDAATTPTSAAVGSGLVVADPDGADDGRDQPADGRQEGKSDDGLALAAEVVAAQGDVAPVEDPSTRTVVVL